MVPFCRRLFPLFLHLLFSRFVYIEIERERENSRNFSLKHGGDEVIYETSHPTMLLSMTCSLYGHFLTLSNVTLR